MPPNTAIGTEPALIVYDRFGNSYDLEEPGLQPTSSCNNGSGYFNLIFFGNLSDAQKLIVCQVFSDISNQITQRQNETACGDEFVSPVNIEVTGLNMGSNVLGSASPLYLSGQAGLSALNCNRIELDRVYARINGGITDVYTDGKLNLNTSPPKPWYLGNTTPADDETFDFYSVVLHEVMHLLGYASGIGIDGLPALGSTQTTRLYSLWDQFLYGTDNYIPNGQSTNVVQVLSGACGVSNCWGINSNLFSSGAAFTNDVVNNCLTPGIDFVFGENAIAPIAGGFGMSPGTNNYALANMLSHLNTTCNGQFIDYVMQPSISDGVSRRNITNPEIDILCEMGYLINSCDNCFLAANFELNLYDQNIFSNPFNECCSESQYYTCINTPLSISFEELLCNDFTNGNEGIEIIDFFTDLPTSSVVETATGIEFTSSIQGERTLYYTIQGCDCRMVNSRVVVTVGPCIDCNDTDPCDNLICSDGFEEFSPYGGNFGSVVNSALGDGIWFYDTQLGSNSPDMCQESNGNIYLRIGSGGAFAADYTEAISLRLQEPIKLGCKALIDMNASMKGSISINYLDVFGSNLYPCLPHDAYNNQGCMPTDCNPLTTYDPICMGEIPIDNIPISSDPFGCETQPNLIPITTFEYKNEENFSINYINLVGRIHQLGPSSITWVFVDDIVITRDCSCAKFTAEGTCVNEAIQFNPLYDIEGVTHSWNFGDGGTNPLPNPSHTYATPGVYVVEHTVKDDCENTSTETIIITITSPLDPTFTYENDPCSSVVDFFSNTTEGDHSWTFTGAGTSTVINPANIDFGANGSYLVSHTVSNECGAITYSETIPIDDCTGSCPCAAGQGTPISVPPGDINISTLGLPFTVSNSCITVPPYSKLIINESHWFSSCTFLMAPGSEIIVRPNVVCSIYSGSQLSGCTQMWRGITLLEGAIFNMGGSTIKDAESAVKFVGKAYAQIQQSTFTNNFAGIHVKGTANGSINLLSSLVFKQNTINSTATSAPLDAPGPGAYLPKYVGQFHGNTIGGDGSNHPYGIVAKYAGISIGNGGAFASNSIQNMATSIDLGNSVAGLSNINISNEDLNFTSYGVFSKKSWLFFNDNNINNCDIAVGATNDLHQINDNIITNCIIGVNSVGAAAVSIERNILTNGGAIAVQSAATNAKPKIKDNILTNNGILVSNCPGGGTPVSENTSVALGEIIDNEITTNKDKGIKIVGSHNLKVYRNQVEFQQGNFNGGTPNGIDIELSNNLRVKDNTVDAAISSGPAAMGIVVKSSYFNHYCCNIVNNTWFGMEFTGACNPSYIRSTEFTPSHQGLRCNNGTVLGLQPHHGNRWFGPFASNSGAQHSGSLEEKEGSRFLVQPPIALPLWPSTNPDSDWFFPTSGNAITSCATNQQCNQPKFPIGLIGTGHEDAFIDDIDVRVATTGYPNSTYGAMLDWESRKVLLNRIKGNNNLLGQHQSVNSFYYSSNATNLDKLVNFENDLHELLAWDEATEAQLNVLIESVLTEINNIRVIDELYALSNNPTEQANLLNQKELAIQNLMTSYQSGTQLLASLEALQLAGISNLENLNAAISPASIFESNEKTVNQIYLQTVAQGILSLDSTQFAIISPIAHQCAMEGGHSVYRARWLYHLNDNKVFNDDELCVVRERKSYAENTFSNNIRIYPNPAKDELNFDFADNKIDKIEVFSLLGGSVLERVLDGTEQFYQLKVDHMLPGLYLCTFYYQNTAIANEKVIIIH